jgi:hypothetical protein
MHHSIQTTKLLSISNSHNQSENQVTPYYAS